MAKVIVLDDNKNEAKQEQIYYDMFALEILERYYDRKLDLNKDKSAIISDKAKRYLISVLRLTPYWLL